MKQLVVIEHDTHDRLVETYIDGELYLSIEPAPDTFLASQPPRILPCEEQEPKSDVTVALAVFAGTAVILLVQLFLKFYGENKWQ